MERTAERMKGAAKLCPRCWGKGVVEAKRSEPLLEGFPGAMRLPCPRCQMAGWVEESEIDCDTTGVW